MSYITPIPDAEAYGKQLEHISNGAIATYHTKNSTDLFKMLNENKKDKTIKVGIK